MAIHILYLTSMKKATISQYSIVTFFNAHSMAHSHLIQTYRLLQRSKPHSVRVNTSLFLSQELLWLLYAWLYLIRHGGICFRMNRCSMFVFHTVFTWLRWVSLSVLTLQKFTQTFIHIDALIFLTKTKKWQLVFFNGESWSAYCLGWLQREFRFRFSVCKWLLCGLIQYIKNNSRPKLSVFWFEV